MSEQADRDALAEVLAAVIPHANWCDYDEKTAEGCQPGFGCNVHAERAHIAEVVLASDWLAQRDRRVAAEAVLEFVAWIARARAHNGSDRQFAQSLYNECINAALPVWSAEWIKGGE